MKTKRTPGWEDLIKLMDRLHLARVQPNRCSTSALPCDGVDSSRKAPTCQKIDESHPFPVAQCILNDDAGDGLYRRVQEQLGLLQTVAYFGQLADETTRTYRLEHLESMRGLHLRTPWLRRISEEGSEPVFAPDARQTGMTEVFRQFRERVGGVQEFARLLDTTEGRKVVKESERTGLGAGLHAFTHPDRRKTKERSDRLSPEEMEHHILLVSDQELSFFSILYVLAEARDHGLTEGVSAKDWLGDRTMRLRSVNRHEHADLDGDPANESDGDRRLEDSPEQYWTPATFEEAMISLGLLADGDATLEATPRLRRLWNRLRAADSWHVLTSAPIDGTERSLAAELEQHLDLRTLSDDGPISPAELRAVAGSLLDLIEACYPKGGSKAVSTSDHVRFNLPGEVLLRKNETSSRSFFATPLSYVVDQPQTTPLAAAFAVGTLDDLNEFTEDACGRIAALRVLLRGLVTFGTDLAQVWLLSARREKEQIQDLNHSIRNMFDPILGKARYLTKVSQGEDARVASGLHGSLRVFKWMLSEALPSRTSNTKDAPRLLHELLQCIQPAVDTSKIVSQLLFDAPHQTLHENTIGHAISVIYNLWNNAIKCADSDRPKIEVALTARKSRVTLTFSNNGSAIPAPFREFLLGINPQPTQSGANNNTGLALVVAGLRALNWRVATVSSCDSTSDGTVISLDIGQLTQNA